MEIIENSEKEFEKENNFKRNWIITEKCHGSNFSFHLFENESKKGDVNSLFQECGQF